MKKQNIALMHGRFNADNKFGIRCGTANCNLPVHARNACRNQVPVGREDVLSFRGFYKCYCRIVGLPSLAAQPQVSGLYPLILATCCCRRSFFLRLCVPSIE
jgi:hypothetical protein